MTPQTPGAPLTGRVPNNHHHSRTHTATTGTATLTPTDGEDEVELFVDPMMGSPLQIFVEKEVPNIELITSLVKKHGGVIGPNYSTVQYILVASNKESGQNLYRQYHNKKGKIVLDARWVLECVKAGELLTFKKNWGGCKVTGEETVIPDPARGAPLAAVQDPIAGPSIPAQGNTSAAPSTFTTQLTPQVNRPKKTRNEPQQLRQHQQQEHDLAQVTQQQPQPFPAFPPPTGTAAPHHLTNAPPPPAPGFPSWNTMQASHPQLPPRHPLHQHPHPQQNHPAAQQVTHLSQVHHRLPQPPQTHLMHPFTVPALAAQARGSWYGVVAGPSPVAGHPAADVGQTGHGGAQGGHPPHAFAHFPDATTWEHHGAPEGVYYQPHVSRCR
ncbi:hypothetical protein FRC03_012200 [Tulasnella sp. 419]|nr:hypothetical protein FRC03_012200 [Tulasnella sp. 419]